MRLLFLFLSGDEQTDSSNVNLLILYDGSLNNRDKSGDEPCATALLRES